MWGKEGKAKIEMKNQTKIANKIIVIKNKEQAYGEMGKGN
jgi:hypothetical protein